MSNLLILQVLTRGRISSALEHKKPAANLRRVLKCQSILRLTDSTLHRVLDVAFCLLGITLGFLGRTLRLRLVATGRFADALLCLTGKLVDLAGHFVCCATHDEYSHAK